MILREVIWHDYWEMIFSTYRTHNNAECITRTNGIRFARRASWKAKRRAASRSRASVQATDRNFIPRLHLAKPSNRGARSLAARWKMSLRGRTNDDDRFCRRSLLLFLIFLWWPPTLYRLLSLVIPVLHASSFSLSFLLSLLSFFSFCLSRFLVPSWVWTPLGRCSWNCLQGGGVKKKDNFVLRWIKENREGKQWLRNDYLETHISYSYVAFYKNFLMHLYTPLLYLFWFIVILSSVNNNYLIKK